jgi:hypothetical protein
MSRAAVQTSLLLTLVAGLAACQDYDIKEIADPNAAGPEIEVSPDRLNFGAVRVGERVELPFTIRSVGSAALELGALTLQAPGAYSLMSEADGALLNPGEETTVVVGYAPTATAESGEVHIESNDPTNPDAVVWLEGAGQLPLLQIDPNPLDFAYRETGSSTTLPVSLINAGSDTLHVGAATIVGEGFSGGMLGPVTLEPGESVDVDVTFNPLIDALYTGEIWVESDAPASPTRGALLGTSLQRPVAICEADPDEIYAVYESTTWVGRDSYDPGGLRIVDYEWALVSAPTGSTAAIRGSGADRPDFVPDLVGEYVAELVVTNENGESSLPCLATLNAVPSTDLWVEMYWTVNNDDMDLHLVNSGGALTSDDDCYYGNCAGRSLDWGVSGASEDDPSLDIDDIPGTGPENINIFRPPEDGFYTVYVHDYTGSTPDYRGDNEVTVNIYIAGELELTDTRTISGDGDYVPIANIDWASRSAFPL